MFSEMEVIENMISLGAKIMLSSDALEYLQDRKILKTSTQCSKCSKTLVKVHSRDRDNYHYFRCSACGVEESIRKGTFLYGKVCSFFRPFYHSFFPFFYWFFSFYNIVFCRTWLPRPSCWFCTCLFGCPRSPLFKLFMRWTLFSPFISKHQNFP